MRSPSAGTTLGAGGTQGGMNKGFTGYGGGGCAEDSNSIKTKWN